MIKFKLTSALVLSLALATGAATAAGQADPESQLRQAMQEAVWPGDVLKAAERYEQAFPEGSWALAAKVLEMRAQESLAMLSSKDIALYTSSVAHLRVNTELGDLARQALLGDDGAAQKLAHRLVKSEPSRAIGWLQWATALGNQKAAYELALHFRTQDQPVLASQYEAKAVALGFEPPSVLDHIRR